MIYNEKNLVISGTVTQKHVAEIFDSAQEPLATVSLARETLVNGCVTVRWHSQVCVWLGMPKDACGSGSLTVFSEWTFIVNDTGITSAEPGELFVPLYGVGLLL